MDQTVGQFDNIIDDIIKQNKVKRFASEVGSMKNKIENLERMEDLKQIMAIIQGVNQENFEKSAKSKINEIYDKINTQTLHWKWSKLSIPQQKDRVKEYLKVTIDNDEKRSQAEKLIFGLIESQKLKKKAITYDTEKSQITGIFIKEYQDLIHNSDSDSDSDSDSNLGEKIESGSDSD